MSFIIRLQNLSRAAKSSDIREFFASLSIPGGSVCICGEDAFAGFETDEDARQAMLRDGAPLCGNRVKLSLSSRKEMQEAMAKAQQMAGVLKGLEKIIRADPNANVDVDVARRGLEPNSQGATSGPQTANGGSTSWILDGQKTSDENSSNWTDFLASALKRIEGAADGSTALAEKPSPSLMGRPAAPTTPAVVRGDPRKPLAVHAEERGPNGEPPSFRPPAIVRNEPTAPVFPPPGERVFGNALNGPQAPVFPPPREQAPSFRPPPYHEKRANEPPFAPNNREFNPQPRPPVRPIQPPPTDYEAALRQQQLAAIEQLNVPAVRQYDPEELFVEMSRLPPNLVDLSNLAEFLRPLVPVEMRAAFGNGLHIHTIVFCPSSMHANNLLKRDGELGIRIRWSDRKTFNAIPVGAAPPPLNPQAWDLAGAPKRPPPVEFDEPFAAKRAREPPAPSAGGSWITRGPSHAASSRPPTSSAADFKPADLNVFHVLLTNVSFKANEWDLSRFLQELNVRYSKLTHVFEPGSSRSDAWIVECNADLDAANLMENERPLMNRALKSELLTPAAAHKIYADGIHPHAAHANGPPPSAAFSPTKRQPAPVRGAFFSGNTHPPAQYSQHVENGSRPFGDHARGRRPSNSHGDFHHRNPEEPSFGHPLEHGGHSSGDSWHQPPGRSFRGRGARGRPGRGRGMRGAPRNF